uniref:Transporter n=1 Tax=Phallusia mammillata TaxID=59560 RepID=A0A6F9DTH1_9ASCI|nr:sodium- and chloride-dependent GABA transporter 2 [Phallusia mammillata]
MDVAINLLDNDKEMKVEVKQSNTALGEKARQSWGSNVQSFLAHLGAVIGLGNIWRFPYIVYAYGGGAFLIPYLVFVIFGGFPLLFLEVAMGQYTREAAINMWNIAPIMKGVGFACTVLVLYSNVYYITVMAWSIFYFVHSLTTSVLPWMHCDNWWNTNSCLPYDKFQFNASQNVTMGAFESSVNESVLPVIEFWDKYVLRKSAGLHELGSLNNWPMVLCLAAAWIIVYFCVFKGVKWSGKVVYFTATFPYIILLVLLVRGCTLDGALGGIHFYLKPNMTKLLEPNVWVQACSQVCYSYAICFAVMVAFGSYNHFHMDCYRHVIFLSVTCSLTSFVAGFAVFSVLGNMAYVMRKNVSDVVASGPGLAFLTYPTGLSMLPLPQLWNSLFFFMLILIAIDSEFACIEGLFSIFYDQWKVLRKYTKSFSAAVCFAQFLFGLLYVTEAGVYIFELFNNFAVSGIALLSVALLESIGVGWIYGADKAYDNIKEMIGYYPSVYIKFCWRFITPALLLGVLIFYIVMYKPLEIGGYVYPDWANGVGWLMCMSSFLCVPIYAIYEVQKHTGTFKERVLKSIAPYGISSPEIKAKLQGNGQT